MRHRSHWSAAGFATASIWIGGVVFAAVTYLLYRWIGRLANR